MEKLDLAKKYKRYYTAGQKPEIIEIEDARFLSVKGKGDPSGDGFTEKIQALYSTAYTLKFLYKSKGKDFTVAKLEGLWWFDELMYRAVSLAEAPVKVPRSEWNYRIQIRMPDFVEEEDGSMAVKTVLAKKQFKAASGIELYSLSEGECVQIMHTGPFENEPETLAILQNFMKDNNLVKNGLHHEIYLSDFNKTPPHKLKTILREPVKWM